VDSRNSAGYFGDRDVRDDALSGQVAATLKWTDSFSTTAQFSRGFRVPTLSDRFFRGPTGRGFVTGNPALRPERSKQADLLVRWTLGQVVLSASAYRYDITELIERFRQGDNFFFRNRGESRIEGAELEAFAALPRSLALQLAVSTSRGEVRGSGEPLGDLAPPNLQATLRWTGKRNTLFSRAVIMDRKKRPGPTERVAGGYAALDVGFTRKLPRDLELRLLLRNAGDRRYVESYDEKGALAPGRSLTLGLLKRL
ncbi:MAG TPA: TonB-dependent receptor, partial [Thermoanaerobaculia bacterium]|nr:TonB-dependent receptor [Thermoanaerobaculia bacterium]